MRIVHLGPPDFPLTFPLGGAIQRRMREVAWWQAGAGREVILYSADSRRGVERIRGAEFRSVPCKLKARFPKTLEYLARASSDLRGEGADVVHFHSLPEGCLFRWPEEAKLFLSYDFYVFRRGKKTPLYWIYKGLLKRYNLLLPVSEYCRWESMRYWKLPGYLAKVVHNGVNMQQFSPDSEAGRREREAAGLGPGPIILYVGRVCEQKGTDTLVEAFQALRVRIPSAQLVVAGPVLEFGKTASSGLVDRIRAAGGHYLGAVDESRLGGVFNLCDVFVLPTRDLEMFGMVAAEAQACGKPVVCTLHGGLPEVVSEESGLFFPVGDSGALAQALESLLSDPARLSALSGQARANASRFGWDAIGRDLDRVYGWGPSA